MAASYGPDISAEEAEQNLQDQKDEILALESIYADVLRVISGPGSESQDPMKHYAECNNEINYQAKDDVFVLQVDASVHLDVEAVTVEAWKPVNEAEGPKPIAEGLQFPNKPEFQRSVSGRRWYSTFVINRLTPISLEVVLPKFYPSAGPPLFTMSCLWLNMQQLSILCKELDRMWDEGQGMPVIFTWIDWLQNTGLSYLGIQGTVHLLPHCHDTEDTEGVDSRAVPGCINLEEGLPRLLRYNYEQCYKEFQQNMQTCGICFEEKMGSQFFRLSDCKHHYCRECLTNYCDYHVTEGTVHLLTCPEPKCPTKLPEEILRATLDGETYDRWERLILQNALDTMGDIEWCPRCNNPVIREEEDNLQLAHCTTCMPMFSFCTKCKEPGHQGSPCEELVEEEEDDNGTKSKKKTSRHQKRLNLVSTRWVQNFTKPCPKCNSPIQKDGGCNNVCCMKCGSHMCWLCGKQIEDYSHFGRCNLWSNVIVPTAPVRKVDEQAEAVKTHIQLHRQEGMKQVKHCPQCRQRNLKKGRNNHIHCYACNAHFCFQCSTILKPPIMSHYKVGATCVQHSD